jgi:hypothetical protein
MFVITLNGNNAFLALDVGALATPVHKQPIDYFATIDVA